jgi:hypothetical protein
MNIFKKQAYALAGLAVAATIGIGSAAAQTGDYSALPVDPNLLTDSLAYSAAPLEFNPDGQPGVTAVYTHREGGSRTITTTILILPDAQAATASLTNDAARVANQQSQPAAVGSGGTMVTGTSPDGSKSVTVLSFTQGIAAATIEFDGPPNDPVPADMVLDYGHKQDTAIRDWQGV